MQFDQDELPEWVPTIDPREEPTFLDNLEYLKVVSHPKWKKLEVTRKTDYAWYRAEHAKAIQAATNTRSDSWDRLPLCLVASLGVTLPDDGIRMALTDRASHFSSATIFGHRRVLDDHLVKRIFKSQGLDSLYGTMNVTERELADQQSLFRRLGPRLEKISLRHYNTLWPAFIPAIIYQGQLRRLELYGPKKCMQSMKALSEFKVVSKLSALQQLELGDLDEWDLEVNVEDLQEFVAYVAPCLRALCLKGIFPLTYVNFLPPMINLRSLDITFKYSYCYNQFLLKKGLLEIISHSVPRLETFGISFKFPSISNGMEMLEERLFRMIGSMGNLRKLALEVIIDGNFRKLNPTQREQKSWKWISDSKQELGNLEELPPGTPEDAVPRLRPKLNKLEVLRIAVHPDGNVKDDRNNTYPYSIIDYRFWLERFQVNVPSVRKLIIEVPVKLDRNSIQLDVVLRASGGPCLWKSLETLVLIYSKNTSLGKSVKELVHNPMYRMNYLSKNVTVLTLLCLPVLNADILDNITQVFPALVELNLSARDKGLYGRKVIQRIMRSISSHIGVDTGFDFDAQMAATVEKLKSLRILRFTDDYEKKCYKTVTAMCNRAIAVGAQQARGLQIPKKLLVRVPLTTKLNLEKLRKKGVTEGMAMANQFIEIY